MPLSITCSKLYKSKISEEQCVQVELITRGQNKNRTWKEQRKGRITSSSFGHVFVHKDTTETDNLVKQVMGYNKTFQNSHLYTKRIQEFHPNTSVKDCGLIINPSYPYLDASPDGLVDIPNFPDGPGLLKIKCPSSDKGKWLSPHECAKDSAFFCSVKDNVVLKRHHSYLYQVQGQMALTGRKWCDFVVWTLKHPMSVERIYFEWNLWLTMVEKLKTFYL
ncbi:uncharacterized protein LOC128248496 [Octopus bimaculoides]|uniref:uncharacterized protein LOC128248496 n=1 Tax=Octopus bimaculoides TaxID=37653 RepID=UPI0022DF9436|nr:uncharacterized protein LOC128248496 [Octopus bimaculoides]